MTMGRAIALLVVSLIVLGGGIAAMVVKVDASVLSSDAGEYSSGARTGGQAATPAGSGGDAAQEARATLTAISRTLTATAPGAPGTPAARTPVPGEVTPSRPASRNRGGLHLYGPPGGDRSRPASSSPTRACAALPSKSARRQPQGPPLQLRALPHSR